MNCSTYFFVLLIIYSNVWLHCEGKQSKILKCYQCDSLSNETEPLCDVDFWRFTTPSEKEQFATMCPSRRSAFCVKLVVWHGKVTKTTRGCTDNRDKRSVPLRVGCSDSIAQGDGGVVCMCDTRLCNGVAADSSGAMGYVAAALVLLLNTRCR